MNGDEVFNNSGKLSTILQAAPFSSPSGLATASALLQHLPLPARPMVCPDGVPCNHSCTARSHGTFMLRRLHSGLHFSRPLFAQRTAKVFSLLATLQRFFDILFTAFRSSLDSPGYSAFTNSDLSERLRNSVPHKGLWHRILRKQGCPFRGSPVFFRGI